MNLTINGTAKNVRAQNLSEAVTTFCKQPKNIMTELNGNIVPPEQWAQTALKDGDTLELVSFVGGG